MTNAVAAALAIAYAGPACSFAEATAISSSAAQAFAPWAIVRRLLNIQRWLSPQQPHLRHQQQRSSHSDGSKRPRGSSFKSQSETREPAEEEHGSRSRRRRQRCDAGWGGFADGSPLESTQLVTDPVHSSDFANFRKFSGEQGPFVFPKARFAFCLIEKNACSAWSTLFNKLVHDDPRLSRPDYYLSTHYSEPADMAAVFSDPGAFRAVVVREPLARFASAFFDKCFANGCASPFCFARHFSRNGRAIPFSDVVDWMLRTDPKRVDGHWMLQSEHCELRTRVREYNVIGFMNRGRLDEDAACITRRAGLARFDTRGANRSFWAESTRNDAQEEEYVLRRLFTKTAARALVRHFAQDYQTFHFPAEPSWVSFATGEWYQATFQDRCQTSLLQSQRNGDLAGDLVFRDADDVVSMAQGAGYPV